jgi:hypothetical protein
MPHTPEEWRRIMDKKWKDLEEQQKTTSRWDIITPTTFPKAANPVPKKVTPKPKPRAAIQKKLDRVIAKNNRAPRFNMEAAGTRRKELAMKINPSVDELKEYRDLSEQIEREVQIKIDKLDPKGAKS